MLRNIAEFENVKDTIFRALSKGRNETETENENVSTEKKDKYSDKGTMRINTSKHNIKPFIIDDNHLGLQCDSVEDEGESLFKLPDPPLTDRGPVSS